MIPIDKFQALCILLKLIQAYIKESRWTTTTKQGLVASFNSYVTSVSIKDVDNWFKQI